VNNRLPKAPKTSQRRTVKFTDNARFLSETPWRLGPTGARRFDPGAVSIRAFEESRWRERHGSPLWVLNRGLGVRLAILGRSFTGRATEGPVRSMGRDRSGLLVWAQEDAFLQCLGTRRLHVPMHTEQVPNWTCRFELSMAQSWGCSSRRTCLMSIVQLRASFRRSGDIAAERFRPWPVWRLRSLGHGSQQSAAEREQRSNFCRRRLANHPK
jgi:hypothetical protein